MKNLSLHEFFHRTKNGSQSRAKKEIIPHYVGAYTTHIYPQRYNMQNLCF